jgi:hypothetical protein
MEAQRLDWYFMDSDKTMKLEAIAIVLGVNEDEVRKMLNVKYPEHLIKSNAFRITKR